jgi:hypothetical protein
MGQEGMSRNMIDRLVRRVEALEEGRPMHRRVLRVIVKNHLESEREIARFKAEQGATDDDLVIARVIVPREQRPSETAKDAYQRELFSASRAP